MIGKEEVLPTSVLQIVGCGYYGGAERQLLALTAGLDPSTYRTTVLFVQGGGPIADQIKRDGYASTMVWGFRYGWSPVLQVKLRGLLKRLKPDIVHFHNYMLMPRITTSLCHHGPLVFTEHGSAFHFAYRRERLTYRLSDTLLARRFDAVVAVSEGVAQALRERSRIQESQLYVIPNPVILERAADIEPRSSSRKPIRLGFVGRLHPVKGAQDLPALMQLVKELDSEVSIRVAGDGPLRDEIEGAAHTLSVADRIDLVGPREDIRSFYESIDVLVVLSRKESFGMAAAEALWMGVPVVGFEAPGISEVAAKGSVLVPPGELKLVAQAIVELQSSADKYTQLSQEGMRWAQSRFDMASFAKRYHELYDHLMRKSSA